MADNHPLAAYRFINGRMTQEALAKELGVTGVTVSRWETGERNIDVDLLPRVSRFTGIPASALRPDLAELMSPIEEPAQ